MAKHGRDHGFRQSTGPKPAVLFSAPVAEPSCLNCIYRKHNGAYSECRRFPPPWIKTDDGDWCGEHKLVIN